MDSKMTRKKLEGINQLTDNPKILNHIKGGFILKVTNVKCETLFNFAQNELEIGISFACKKKLFVKN